MLLSIEKNKKKNIVLEGNLYKGLIFLSIPIIFNNFLQTLYNLADTFWVSIISDKNVEVTAVGAVSPILAFIIAFGAGLQIAGTSLMSQHIGANEEEKANEVASQLFLFALVLGIVMTVVGLVSAPWLLDFMKLKGEVYDLGLIYLRIIYLEIPLVFCLMIFTAMRQAKGDTLMPVIFSVISVLLNVVLDPVFIMVFHQGVAGVAIATVLAKLIIVPFWLYLSFFDKNNIHISIKQMRMKLSIFNQIWNVMIPASMGQALNSAGFIVLNKYIYEYGDAAMSAYTVGNRITSLVTMPAMGFGSALAFYVGQNIGNNNIRRAKKSFYAALNLSLIVTFIGMIALMPEPIRIFIAKIFLKGDDVKIAVEYILFVGFSVPLMGLFQNFTGVFQGAGKTKYTFWMSILRLWGVRIPLIIMFKNLTSLGTTGIWYSMVISNMAVCLLAYLLYVFGKWQRKIV